jgi:two-component SAPR family response regulator
MMGMQNGLIVEDHSIIALDLKITLSRRSNIVGVVSSSKEAEKYKYYDLQFIVMDTDIRDSVIELPKIIDMFDHCHPKIVLISSTPSNLEEPHYKHNLVVQKPYSNESLLQVLS